MGKLMFIGYTLAAGILMAVFVLTPGMLRHAFSLGAVLVGIRFFQRWEELSPRIWFIVLVLLCALVLPFIYVMLAYANGWYVDPRYLGE